MAIFNTYYSANEILGYKALFNLVLSDRSDGKTFNCKVRALEDFDKLGETTVYVRRYDTEITPKMYNTFFNEVFLVEKYAWYEQKYEFRHSKAGVEIRLRDKYENKKEGWSWIVYFVPLSKAGKLKSQLDITNIRTIDFDEYMPLDGRYLKDEMMLLMELWKSIDRDRDRTQCILLGNKIDPFCPFFDFFGIDLDIERARIRTYRSGSVAVQVYVNEEHRQVRQESKFTNAIKGTAYEEYDAGGIMRKANITLEALDTDKYEYYCSFCTKYGEGSIWRNKEDNGLLVSDRIRKDGIVLTDTTFTKDDGRRYYNISFTPFVKTIKATYYSNRFRTTSKNAFHNIQPMLAKLNVR